MTNKHPVTFYYQPRDELRLPWQQKRAFLHWMQSNHFRQQGTCFNHLLETSSVCYYPNHTLSPPHRKHTWDVKGCRAAWGCQEWSQRVWFTSSVHSAVQLVPMGAMWEYSHLNHKKSATSVTPWHPCPPEISSVQDVPAVSLRTRRGKPTLQTANLKRYIDTWLLTRSFGVTRLNTSLCNWSYVK